MKTRFAATGWIARTLEWGPATIWICLLVAYVVA